MAQIPSILFPNLVSVREKSSLRCPDCESPMRLFSCGNVIIDKCPNCQGIWFDARELGVFRDTLQAHDLRPLKVMAPDAEAEAPVVPTIRGCPRDGEVLTAFIYSYNSKVRLNRCDRCNGIWSPFVEIIHLVEYAKISQVIEPDVKALGRELLKHNERVRRWRDLGNIGESLAQPVRYGFRRPLGIVLPLGTDQVVRDGCYGTFGILLSCLIVAVLYGRGSDALAMTPVALGSGWNWTTLFTALFAHAGVGHLLGNFLYLWLFGMAVETRIGWKKFITAYFLCGVFANVLVYLTDPASSVPVLGASGAISGVLGAYLRFFPTAKVKTLAGRAIVDVPAWIYLGVWFAMQILMSLATRESGLGGVAWSAHIGGFIAGYFLAFGMN